MNTRYDFGTVLTSLLTLISAILAFGCSSKAAPQTFETLEVAPAVYPDYSDVVFPPNIAPANFRIEEDGDDYVTEFRGENDGVFTIKGQVVDVPEKSWRFLLEKNKNAFFQITSYVKRDGKWFRFAPITCSVSPDPIDGFVAYRLIEPGYDYAHRIALAQRSLESYEERVFLDNRFTNSSPCVNCHSFQDRKTDRFLFHYRRTEDPTNGGTIIVDGKSVKKVGGFLESAGISCSYPAWRPTGDLVAFSSNMTRQTFHSLSTQKLEVYDAFSDLVLFDAKKNKLVQITDSAEEFETFPSWSPDGNVLYYCCAHFKLEDAPTQRDALIEAMAKRSGDLRYDVMKRTFDESTRSFGDPELVVDASSNKRSALFPRVSPDGRFLVYTLAASGTFPIWRPEADLWIKDLQTGEERRWDELDSDNSDSYHTWSSNGRWIVLSSRREDGLYTRLYFAHVDENGVASKPFLLPQKNPNHNRERFKSYNVPEFTVEPIKIETRDILNAALKKPEKTENVERL